MTRFCQAVIDTQALQHNVTRVRAFAPQSRVLAVVKANAYGHGLECIVKALADADGFGVSCVAEAVRLREAGVLNRIVLMEGIFDASDLKWVDQYELDVVIHDVWQADALLATKLTKPVCVWLKIDSGMHRLGLMPEQFQQVYTRLQACTQIKSPMIVMTHFAQAWIEDDSMTRSQLAVVLRCCENKAVETSLANSAAILQWPMTHGDWVRAGIILYGASPVPGRVGHDHGFKPVMTLSAKLIAVHDLQAGEAVGYGRHWICPQAMRVGVVSIGYGDGYPRHAPTGTPMLIRRQRCPLIGKVNMDMITVDLSTCPQAMLGDEVVLWGQGLPAEDVADRVGTIAYELFSQVTSRVDFVTK